MGKILCLYYSRTGFTEKLMSRISSELDADILSFTDGIDRSGIWGYIKSCIDCIAHKYPSIREPEVDFSQYSDAIIAMPIWVENANIVGQAFIQQYKEKLPENVHFVITHMAPLDYLKAISTLDGLLGRSHKSFLTISSKHTEGNDEKIESFIKALKV